jgi:hypothetical protein
MRRWICGRYLSIEPLSNQRPIEQTFVGQKVLIAEDCHHSHGDGDGTLGRQQGKGSDIRAG